MCEQKAAIAHLFLSFFCCTVSTNGILEEHCSLEQHMRWTREGQQNIPRRELVPVQFALDDMHIYFDMYK
ncbi:hypothetical protein GUJ93_ZPchr0009g1515 [Zizania palustris]|uniref:Secreted protein n=1 Tax=Zizania palustris TaxID=103762 RepID=A0A8J5S3U7_ZIZPA|nr:hypothetical protein GUJ93_ZPchr0009g1515 [Zizania palustris]